MADIGTVQGNVPADPARQAELQEFARQRSADPRGYFARVRAQGPLDFNEGADGSVQVLNRGDVEFVLRQTELFSNVMGIMGSEEPVIPLGVDPPQHSTYRRLLDPLFSPRRMAALQPAVATHVNAMIDSFIGQGTADFSAEMAVPLPCLTFLSLLGLPAEELPQLVRWKDIMIRPDVVAGSVQAGQKLQMETAGLIYAYFTSAMEQRRAEPRDDLISFLLNAEVDDGRRLDDGEILRILFLLLAAGLDTVTISLECIFQYLVTHPQARQMLESEPESLNDLIEELLRWETPVQACSARRATRDVEVAGCPVKAGTLLLPMIAAANLDPETPGALDIDLRRGDHRHLAFGGGPHRCLGSHLARMELRTVVREWHRRIPDYRLKPGVVIEWNGSSLRGVDYLPLEWDRQGKDEQRG
jgi:cytochrome P450